MLLFYLNIFDFLPVPKNLPLPLMSSLELLARISETKVGAIMHKFLGAKLRDYRRSVVGTLYKFLTIIFSRHLI